MAFVRAYSSKREIWGGHHGSDVGNKILCLGHYSLDKTNLYAMPDG